MNAPSAEKQCCLSGPDRGNGWIPTLLQGDRAAIARAINSVENNAADMLSVISAIDGLPSRAHVVGFTGSPGVGKSSLIGSYISELRRRGYKVGVIAVDPSSHRSGGAVLGDRVRMMNAANDADVFVRSVSSRGNSGGLSINCGLIVDILDAAGKDYVLVETVGAGQSEVEIADLADTRVVVCAPGFGDALQSIKGGILEIADILVLNKADLDAAEQAFANLKVLQRTTTLENKHPELIKTSVQTSTGINELAELIELRHGESRRQSEKYIQPKWRLRKVIATLAAEYFKQRLLATGSDLPERLFQEVFRGGEVSEQALAEIIRSTFPDGD